MLVKLARKHESLRRSDKRNMNSFTEKYQTNPLEGRFMCFSVSSFYVEM